MENVIGLIPARGGSKELPGKNTALLNGKPLLAYSIETAHASGSCDQIVVSSDSDVILSVAEELQASAHRRESGLAQDDTPMDPVIADVIAARQCSPRDLIVLLQPTSPLRTAQHIRDALRCYRQYGCRESSGKVLVSVCAIANKYLKVYLRNGDFLEPAFAAATAYQRRQDLPELFMPNGAIYIFSVADFLQGDCIPRDGIVPFVMTTEDSCDVDTEADLERCEQLLSARAENVKNATQKENI